MKTWLKGGLIGVGIYVLMFVIALLFCSSGIGSTKASGLFCVFLLFAASRNPFLIIRMVVIYFFIGALIGWIIGKIKSK